MRNKWIKRLFPVLALLLLAPWPVAYANTFDGAMAGQDGVQIEVAEALAQPTWTAFGKAIGGVTPGDLFYIDATDNPADVVVTLEMVNHYLHFTSSQITAQHHKYSPMDRMQEKGRLGAAS